jgi:hypothetical protein
MQFASLRHFKSMFIGSNIHGGNTAGAYIPPYRRMLGSKTVDEMPHETSKSYDRPSTSNGPFRKGYGGGGSGGGYSGYTGSSFRRPSGPRDSSSSYRGKRVDHEDVSGESDMTMNPLIGKPIKELLAETPTGINFDKYDDIPVEVTGEDSPTPVMSFDEAGLHPTLFSTVREVGFIKPTPVQKYSLAIGTAGRDLMACAQTGSGKTVAFL